MNKIKFTKEEKRILAWIKSTLNKRPTYGYKRITAIINRQNQVKYNKKRIYRLMKCEGLLQAKSLVVGPLGRAHTGKVMTLHSNTRWCSDAFEIECWNGERVYVAFSLDCCDRECIAYNANDKDLTQTDIQVLMQESVWSRFKQDRAPNIIQWLTDRGSIYRAHETVELGKWLNLTCCFTASRSPESNGMAESFVKTIKRDYVYVNDCVDAKTVLRMIPEWIRDYNQNHPHSALGMKSPWEYLNKAS